MSDAQTAQDPSVAGTEASDLAQAPSGGRFDWIGGASGSWADAANWLDLSTGQPAQMAPGPDDSVVIDGAGGTTITGAGASHDLSVSGSVLFDGAFATGTLLAAGVAGSLCVSADASLAILGDAVSGAAASPDADGADTGDVPCTSHAGWLTVAAGASLDMTDALAAMPIWNDGTVVLGASGAIPTGPILGDGTLLVESGFESSVAYAATWRLGPALGAQQQIRFDGPDASLFLGSDGDDAATPILVRDFAPTDLLAVAGSVTSMQLVDTPDGELLDLTLRSSVFDVAGSTLEILFRQDDDAAEGLAFDTSFVATGSYGSGYTEITLQPSTPCFCPGTLIATPDGERPVERLRIGDPVLTAGGERRTVLWIGRRSYHARLVASRPDLQPVRFQAGALGHGMPRRDLLVSPRHAMLVQGVLVPAELLVNGCSVSRETGVRDIAYLHVELDNHELLLAEGAATESFVDDDSRAMFQNAHEFALLYPDRPSRPPRWCAPRVEDGARLLLAQSCVDALAGLLPEHAPSPLQGRVDAMDGGRVRGWAWCPEQPDAPVLLDILADGVPAAQVLADRYRADLADAGIGAGCHGFEAALPDGAASVQVRRARDGARLAAAWAPPP